MGCREILQEKRMPTENPVQTETPPATTPPPKPETDNENNVPKPPGNPHDKPPMYVDGRG